ncbi:hypothetical protein KAT89_03315 [candidate division WOR-3 bacterium]|nr:hypothetical protein [candidate division WOR-3 bacterium]
MKSFRICIISFSNLKNDPRVRRQIDLLKDIYDVTTLGLKKSGVKGVDEFIIPTKRSIITKIRSRLTFLIARFFQGLYTKYIEIKYPLNTILKIISDKNFDLVIANGLGALIVAERIARRDGAKILFDAHEYEPRRIEDHWFHRLFINPHNAFLCNKYLPHASYMTTVSLGIANEYNKSYGISPEVIFNAPEYERVNFKEVKQDNIRMIHHGIAHPSRKLEDMIHLMSFLEKRFHLTLMLVANDTRYYNYLKKLSNKLCPSKVAFREPVSFNEIISTISDYDIGLIILRPTSFKLKHALPNKFFESIMAGLALVIGPSPEMKNIIEKFNCGVFSNSFNVKEIAKLINSLTPKQIMEKKKGSLEAAKFLNSEREMKKLHRIVRMILS